MKFHQNNFLENVFKKFYEKFILQFVQRNGN